MTTPNVAFAVFNGMWPVHLDAEHGPKSLWYNLAFSATIAQIEVNLSEDEMMSQLKFIQTLYIDNADNGGALTITVGQSQQRVKWKPNTQGYLPLLVPNGARITFATPAAAVNVPIIFINVPMAPIQWTTV
jgi:hypothetical protein